MLFFRDFRNRFRCRNIISYLLENALRQRLQLGQDLLTTVFCLGNFLSQLDHL